MTILSVSFAGKTFEQVQEEVFQMVTNGNATMADALDTMTSFTNMYMSKLPPAPSAWTPSAPALMPVQDGSLAIELPDTSDAAQSEEDLARAMEDTGYGGVLDQLSIMNTASWVENPLQKILCDNIRKALEENPEQQEVFENYIMSNIHVKDVLTTQEMKNLSKTYLHFIDHAFGGGGPIAWTTKSECFTSLPKESLQMEKALDEYHLAYFVIMHRAKSGVVMRMKDGDWEVKRVKPLTAASPYDIYECIFKQLVRVFNKEMSRMGHSKWKQDTSSDYLSDLLEPGTAIFKKEHVFDTVPWHVVVPFDVEFVKAIMDYYKTGVDNGWAKEEAIEWKTAWKNFQLWFPALCVDTPVPGLKPGNDCVILNIQKTYQMLFEFNGQEPHLFYASEYHAGDAEWVSNWNKVQFPNGEDGQRSKRAKGTSSKGPSKGTGKGYVDNAYQTDQTDTGGQSWNQGWNYDKQSESKGWSSSSYTTNYADALQTKGSGGSASNKSEAKGSNWD